MSETRGAMLIRPTEGEHLDIVGDRYRLLATSEQTQGRYGLLEAVVPPGGGPPPHRHSREEEGFYMLEGELAFYEGDTRIVAGPGSFVHLPAGSTHRFHNESDRPARMLILLAPGGLEAMFRRVGQPVSDPNSPIQAPDDTQIRRLLEAAPEYGVDIQAG